MREVKFRVWDNEEKEMLEVVSLGVSHNWPMLVFKDGYINGLDSEDYDVMQYTGLKDNNGVEIYEGDVITTSSSGARCTEVLYGHYEDAYGAFDEDHYGLHTMQWGTLPDVISNGGVVIGNKYEHAHLIE